MILVLLLLFRVLKFSGRVLSGLRGLGKVVGLGRFYLGLDDLGFGRVCRFILVRRDQVSI